MAPKQRLFVLPAPTGDDSLSSWSSSAPVLLLRDFLLCQEGRLLDSEVRQNHPVALCALQGPLQGQGRCLCWRELTKLARCTRGANWTAMMGCTADSVLSEPQRRQFSATAARAEYRIIPQPRRKSCNGLSLYGFCGDATAYAARDSSQNREHCRYLSRANLIRTSDSSRQLI